MGEKEVCVSFNMKCLCGDGHMLYLDCMKYILVVMACCSFARWDGESLLLLIAACESTII